MSINLPGRKLISQNDQAIIQRADVPRSKFTNAWTRKTTFNAGKLVPFLVEEILPGDHMTYDVTAYVRMSTPLFPLFDNQRIDTFFFFVPNRLLWDNWKKFMGEQADPNSSISYTIPQIVSPANGGVAQSLWDHFGLPTAGQISGGNTITVNALPFRAYTKIYNDWFRDENAQNSEALSTADGPDITTGTGLQERAKSHDYFTSALPWPQKFTAPTIPLLGTAPITGLGAGNKTNMNIAQSVWETGGGNPTYAYGKALWDGSTNDTKVYMEMDGATGAPLVYADLTQATGVAINQLRQAWLVQSLLERDARGGTRYVELIKSHFGVTSPDFRLQRPEYIGGGQSPLQLTPIAQTAPTTGVPLGALGAAGTASGHHKASYAATEHGWIIGIINVRSEISYQQGVWKMWSRLTREDHYFPSLAGLGEQAILQQEIYATGAAVDDNIVFGYQERWHEYRTRVSEVTGQFRSTLAAGTLDAWHLAQKFLTPPAIGPSFIPDRPPMSRVLAAAALADGQQYLADILINRTAVRPLPVFGTPVSIGRF